MSFQFHSRFWLFSIDFYSIWLVLQMMTVFHELTDMLQACYLKA